MIVKPFFNWIGGKQRLISQLDELLPTELKEGKIELYFEPFLGSGAMMFHILNKYPNVKIIASDINDEVIVCFEAIRDYCEKVISALRKIKTEYDNCENMELKENYFYKLRMQYNDFIRWYKKGIRKRALHVNLASYFIALSFLGFNGLYRVNQRGEYNVPFGKRKKFVNIDEENLRECAKKMKDNVLFLHDDYEHLMELALLGWMVNKKIFIYLDPPYLPIGKNKVIDYNSQKFDEKEHLRLSFVFKMLNQQGCFLMESNSDCKYVEYLYQDFEIHKIEVNRLISANAKTRGKIKEIVVTNY